MQGKSCLSRVSKYTHVPHTCIQAVIVNFPHNPTGALLSQLQWKEVCACCENQDAYLFSDEMYRGLEHDASAKMPAAVDSYKRGISLCGMSKALSMPGLQIGWVAMHNTELLQQILQLKDYTTICSSAPSEVCCAPSALFVDPLSQQGSWRPTCNACRERLSLCCSWFTLPHLAKASILLYFVVLQVLALMGLRNQNTIMQATRV